MDCPCIVDQFQSRTITALLWILLVSTTLLFLVDDSNDGPAWTVWSNVFYAFIAFLALLFHPPQYFDKSSILYWYKLLFPIYVFHIACASFTYHRTNTLWAQQWDTTAINLYAIFELAITIHPVIIIICSPASPFAPAPLFPTIVVSLVLTVEFLISVLRGNIIRTGYICGAIAFTLIATVTFLIPDNGTEHGLWHMFSSGGLLMFYLARLNHL